MDVARAPMRMKARELCPCTYNLLKLPSGAASLIPDRDKPCNVLGKFTALCCMALIAGTTGKKVRHPRRGFKEGEFGRSVKEPISTVVISDSLDEKACLN